MINSLTRKNEPIPISVNDMFEYFISLNSNDEPFTNEREQTLVISIE